jgi:hypothetical protein
MSRENSQSHTRSLLGFAELNYSDFWHPHGYSPVLVAEVQLPYIPADHRRVGCVHMRSQRIGKFMRITHHRQDPIASFGHQGTDY